jgi:hypothetical protein
LASFADAGGGHGRRQLAGGRLGGAIPAAVDGHETLVRFFRAQAARFGTRIAHRFHAERGQFRFVARQ